MPELARSPNHLFRRGTTYYFRLAIPMHLRNIIGQREIRMSLGTSYLYQARRIASRLHSNGLEFFREVENMPKDITKQKLKELKAHFFHDQIMIDEALRLKLPHRSQLTLQQSMESLEELKKELHLEMASGQLMTGKAKLLKHLVYNSLDPALDGVADEKIYLEITKALADAVEVMLHRKQGDFNFEETVMEKYTIQQKQATEAKATPTPKTMKVSELIKKFSDNRINSGRWKENDISTYQGRLNWLTFITNDVDVSKIDFALMEDFRDKLTRMPQNRKRLKAYKDLTVEEILACDVEKPLTSGGINNIIGGIGTMFDYAIKLEEMDRNFAKGLKVKEKKSPDEKRYPFTQEDLHALFHPHEHIDRVFNRPERFWVSMLCLLQGMRLEEAAQLHLDDIYEQNGHIVIDINDKEEKSTKNAPSQRVLPLHPILRDTLNFPAFVAKVRRTKTKRLFPALKHTAKRKKYGNAVGAWFNRLVKSTGVKETDKNKSQHSLRHTFIGIVDHLEGVEDKYIVGVTGHSRKETSIDPAYLKKFAPDVLYDLVVSKIGNFGLDWDKITESKFVAKK